MNKVGTQSIGIKAPLIKAGDDIVNIVVNSVLNATRIDPPKGTMWLSETYHYDLNDHDIIGITESVIARSQNNYVTIDEIACNIKEKYGIDATIDIIEPIYSRNRFAMILKGIARGVKKVRPPFGCPPPKPTSVYSFISAIFFLILPKSIMEYLELKSIWGISSGGFNVRPFFV